MRSHLRGDSVLRTGFRRRASARFRSMRLCRHRNGGVDRASRKALACTPLPAQCPVILAFEGDSGGFFVLGLSCRVDDRGMVATGPSLPGRSRVRNDLRSCALDGRCAGLPGKHPTGLARARMPHRACILRSWGWEHPVRSMHELPDRHLVGAWYRGQRSRVRPGCRLA